jgi:hypothetical protein
MKLILLNENTKEILAVFLKAILKCYINEKFDETWLTSYMI